MLSALMFTVRSLRTSLSSEGGVSGPIYPQPEVISLSHDELPAYLLQDLGIPNGNRSDRRPSIRQRPLARPAGISAACDSLCCMSGGIVTTAACRRRVSHDHD